MAITVLRIAQAELLGPPDGARDRFLLSAADAGGRLSLVEHHAPPSTLIAPAAPAHPERTSSVSSSR